MYEAKSEANEFVGTDRADAIGQAARFFGVEEEALRVVEPEEGEIFGVGGRTVVVVVPRDVKSQPRRDARGESDRGDRPDRGSRSDRGGRSDRGNRSDRGDRPDRGDRVEQADRDGGRSERESGNREIQAELSENGGERAEEEVGESRGVVQGEIGTVGEFLVGAIERMKIGPFEIAESEEGKYLVYELSGRAAEVLGGGDGRAAEALQLLANQATKRGSEEGPRVVIDMAGNVARREANLQRLAERAGRRAQDSKRSIALDPMNGGDRRILHMAVRELDGVVTMSVGEGGYRQVVIVPEGAAEYEEAREASEKIEAEREERS
jgi:spoIIIJ-associated protein